MGILGPCRCPRATPPHHPRSSLLVRQVVRNLFFQAAFPGMSLASVRLTLFQRLLAIFHVLYVVNNSFSKLKVLSHMEKRQESLLRL